MDNSSVIEIAILRNLLDKKGRISSYALYKKLKIPMSDFMKTIFHLADEKYVEFDGDWLKITPVGQSFLIQRKSKKDRGEKLGVPEGFLRQFRLLPGDAYVPSRSRLDSSLLNK